MIRLINICVIAALFVAAAYVYKIKFESTQRAEQVAKLRTEIRREHDAIAGLRAEWSRLDNPARIQELAKRHLALKPIEQRQFDRLDQLPERPSPLVPAGVSDPIGFLIALPELGDTPTASITPPRKSER
jgi:cell division protein FtsL